MPAAVAIPAIIGAAGVGTSIASGAMASNAAEDAANTQASASVHAADLQAQAQKAALQEQKRQFDTGQSNLQPWQQGGLAAYGTLLSGMGINPLQGASGTAGGAAGSSDTSQQSAQIKSRIDELQRSLAEMQKQGYIQKGADLYGNPTYETVGGLSSYSGQTARNQANSQSAELQQLQDQLAGLQQSSNSPFQFQQTGTNQQGTAGANPVGAASDPNAVQFGEFNKQFEWDPNTNPAYQFRLSEGSKLIQRAAASKGSLWSGGTAKALTQYAQDYASNEYENAYNRFQNEQATRFNRLSTLAGGGQTAATNSAAAGQNYATGVSNTLTSGAQQQGQYATNAANAQAAGQVGSTNAWNSALANVNNTVSGAIQLGQLMKQNQTPQAPGVNPMAQNLLTGGTGA